MQSALGTTPTRVVAVLVDQRRRGDSSKRIGMWHLRAPCSMAEELLGLRRPRPLRSSLHQHRAGVVAAGEEQHARRLMRSGGGIGVLQ